MPPRNAAPRIASLMSSTSITGCEQIAHLGLQLHVQVSAVPALHAGGMEVFSQQQRLNLSGFERSQNMPQPHCSQRLSLRFSQHLADEFLAPVPLVLAEQLLDAVLQLLWRRRHRVAMEAANQTLLQIRMQHRFELGPILVADSHRQPFAASAFEIFQDRIRHLLVVLLGGFGNSRCPACPAS